MSGDEDFAQGQFGQFSLMAVDDEIMADYFTWDLLLKNVAKLPSPDGFQARIRHAGFYDNNKWIYNPPFLVFYQENKQVP